MRASVCADCVIRYRFNLGDDDPYPEVIPPATISRTQVRCARLIRRWYGGTRAMFGWSTISDGHREREHCVGASLHIVTDDFNIEDDSLAFCRADLHTVGDPSGYRELCTGECCSDGEEILDMLAVMTEAARAVAVGMAHRAVVGGVRWHGSPRGDA
jgi:hypothetical protein